MPRRSSGWMGSTRSSEMAKLLPGLGGRSGHNLARVEVGRDLLLGATDGAAPAADAVAGKPAGVHEVVNGTRGDPEPFSDLIHFQHGTVHETVPCCIPALARPGPLRADPALPHHLHAQPVQADHP